MPARADDLSRYLAEHELPQVLAVHLEHELGGAQGERRDELLRRLAELYAELLESTTDETMRESISRRGRALLADAPRDGAQALRLALLRGPYRMAEKIAERHRLRLATPEELQQAKDALSKAIPELRAIAEIVDQSADVSRRRLSRADAREATRLSAEADRAQQIASQCQFLTAWALYYQSFLHERRDQAAEAQDLFAKLLDPESPATRPENVSTDLRAVEPFARSILGMALSRSMTSGSTDALRWLSLLEHDMTAAGLREQLPVWRMVIYLEDEEFEHALAELRDVMGGEGTAPALWLRLLAVHCAEKKNDSTARECLRVAVTQLAAQGELEHVLDLARRYGDDLLGDSGFAMHYVTGLLAYQKARDAHGSENAPADDRSAALYEEAARALAAAIEQGDAKEYASAAAGAMRLIGLCRYFQGRFLDARDAFVRAAERLPSDQAAEALWMAIASLDHVVKAGDNAALKRDLHGLIDTFLARYPSSRHAPKLVVRRAATSDKPTRAAAAELLAVPSNSDVYDDARQRAATILYQLFRQAPPAEKVELGNDYLNVAVAMAARGVDSAADNEAGRERLLVQCRRILEVSLSRGIERLSAATTALEVIDRLRGDGEFSNDINAELQFRRLQFDLASGRVVEARTAADALWSADASSLWAQVAARAMFSFGREQLETATINKTDASAALDLIVQYGGRVLREYESDPAALRDRAVLLYHLSVAEAAMALWEKSNRRDAAMGRRALFLYDTKLLAQHPDNAEFLRSTAILAEVAGERERALECWRRLVSGLPATSAGWFEAKFRLITILAQSDPARARAVMDQHKLLNPEYGPDPWGARLRSLDLRLTGQPAPTDNNTKPAGDDSGQVEEADRAGNDAVHEREQAGAGPVRKRAVRA